MKKFIYILTFLIITAFSFSEETQISENNSSTVVATEKKDIEGTTRIAFLLDIDGTFNDDDALSLNKSLGGQILLERAYRLNSQIELGFGLGIQANEEIDTELACLDSFYSAPIYITGKYNVIGGALYVKARLGIPLSLADENLKCYLTDSNTSIDSNTLELDGKFYGGLAVGLDYGTYEWECGYSYNLMNYKYNENGVNKSKSLENIRVSIGFSKTL